MKYYGTRFIFKFIPVPVFVTNKLRHKQFQGESWVFFVLIRPSVLEQHRESLVAHELTHCKQAWKYGIIPFKLLYWCSPKWRLKFEIEGYTTQLIALSLDVNLRRLAIQEMVESMYKKYNLGLSYEEIYEKFTRYLRERNIEF